MEPYSVEPILTQVENHGVDSTKTSPISSHHFWKKCVIDIMKPSVPSRNMTTYSHDFWCHGYNEKPAVTKRTRRQFDENDGGHRLLYIARYTRHNVHIYRSICLSVCMTSSSFILTLHYGLGDAVITICGYMIIICNTIVIYF